MSGRQKILILKYRAMGDAIIGLSGVQYFRQLFPNAYLIYGVPQWTAPLFSRSQTAADEILPLSLNSVSDWVNLWHYLIDQKVDLVYEMFQSGRTSKFFNLFSAITGKPYFFHNHHSHSHKNPKILDQGMIKPVIQRDLDGIYYQLAPPGSMLPHFFDYEPKLNSQRNGAFNSDSAVRKIIFGVVATRETKKLPLSTYLKLAYEIERLDPAIEILVPLSNSSEDRKAGETILQQKSSNNIKLIFEKLADLPGRLASSRLYIGNDTGLKHLAVSMGIKTLTFFGPEPPLEWHPYSQKRHPYFYLDGLECRTRDAHYCGLKTCESMICLNQFKVEDILEKIKGDLR